MISIDLRDGNKDESDEVGGQPVRLSKGTKSTVFGISSLAPAVGDPAIPQTKAGKSFAEVFGQGIKAGNDGAC